MSSHPRALVPLFGLLVATGGCGPVVDATDASQRCSVDASIACACTDGRDGRQVCRADGTYGACTCGAGTDAGVDAAHDARPDVSTDSPADASVDAGTDAVSSLDASDASIADVNAIDATDSAPDMSAADVVAVDAMDAVDATTDVPGLDGGACHVMVNEIQTGGAGGATDEWVELFNPCPSAVDLNGARLVYRSAAGTTDTTLVTFALGVTSISAGGYLIASNALSSVAHDLTFVGGLAATGGGVALKDTSGAIVDSVGYGTATNSFIEGTVAVAPPSSQSIARIPNGHDSNDNASDFVLSATPTPHAAN